MALRTIFKKGYEKVSGYKRRKIIQMYPLTFDMVVPQDSQTIDKTPNHFKPKKWIKHFVSVFGCCVKRK
jgi:hypothetical protein